MPTSSGQTATIFIADDNPILLQGLNRALTSNGYTVATAGNGAAVLALIEEAPVLPDLVLLDVMMPELSGLEVLRALRADPRLAGVPVMLVTAATDEALPARALESGAVEVLIKPFRLTELLERIQANVQRGRAGAAAG